MLKRLMLAAAFVLPLPLDASAARVVTTCGSPPVTLAVGSTVQITVDTNGRVCI